MRISDWSSDVCSSDLGDAEQQRRAQGHAHDILNQRLPRNRNAAAHTHADEDLGKRIQQDADNDHAEDCIFTRHDSTPVRSEEHTSELQSLMRISYAVFCLKKKKI